MQNNILAYLDKTVERFPEKPAFVDENSSYTFAQVYEESRSIGSFLADTGLRREPVVVFMKKSCKMVTAFLGVLQAGCFYVPLDMSMPELRIEMILENCRPKIILCDEDTKEKAEEILKGIKKKNDEIGKTIETLYDDLCQYPIRDGILDRIRKQALDIDPMYIVFTSGSTGVPKGVCACHRSVIEYIEQLSKVLQFDEGTVFGNQSPLYFDACLKEIYPTLKFGATTYLIPQSLFLFPVKLVEFLNEKRINTICWVVSALTMISSVGALDKCVPRYLRTVAFGSEVFPVKQFQIWKDKLKNTAFFNLYGPTEGTGMCCYYPVKREFASGENIPIGYPFENTEIMLVKEDGKPAEDGEQGEIYIRGTCVTLGYYNNPSQTAKNFVQNPMVDSYPDIVYRTGDIGRKNQYGELEFISRKDYQIKHMGHRIELGEIEANVNVEEDIQFSACTYEKECGKIVLWYVGQIDEGELTRRLRKRLPRYMMPNQVMRLENMPFTANGKIDRNSLRSKEGNKNNRGITDGNIN